LRLRRGHEDPPATGSPGGSGPIEPGGDSPAGEVPVPYVALDLGIEHPALPSRGRVQRDHPPQRGAKVHRPVYHEGSRLEGSLLVGLETGVGLSGAVRPRHCEAGDVLPGDRRRRTVTASLGVAPVGAPVDFLTMQHDGSAPEQQRGHQYTHAPPPRVNCQWLDVETSLGPRMLHGT
jgi:hypothetical protein